MRRDADATRWANSWPPPGTPGTESREVQSRAGGRANRGRSATRFGKQLVVRERCPIRDQRTGSHSQPFRLIRLFRSYRIAIVKITSGLQTGAFGSGTKAAYAVGGHYLLGVHLPDNPLASENCVTRYHSRPCCEILGFRKSQTFQVGSAAGAALRMADPDRAREEAGRPPTQGRRRGSARRVAGATWGCSAPWPSASVRSRS